MSAVARLLPRCPESAPAAEPQTETGPLWLCCHLPDLPLAAIDPELRRSDVPHVVLGKNRRQPQVLLANQAARKLGIAPAIGLNAAMALCPQLRIHERDPQRELVTLSRLAEQCQQFTPWVGLEYPLSLVLEIRGSLKLFGGLEAIQHRLRELLREAGHDCRLALAPSSLAGWLLASQGLERIVESHRELRSALGGLAIASLPLEERVRKQLGQAGLHTLRDLWRLPRDGLRKRYGREFLSMLDRTAGTGIDLPSPHRIPPRFAAELELPLETANLNHYWPAVERLAGQMLGFLSSGDLAVARCTLLLRHAGQAQTPVPLELRRPTRDPGHLLALLKEKLENNRLYAPVRGIALHTDLVRPPTPEITDLFGARPAGDGDWQRLLETLSVRLGREAIRSFASVADFRPERAHRSGGGSNSAALPPGRARPLWLLPRPKPARLGDLKLAAGTERIETGWWDDQPIRRDYRTATDAQGRRWWLYRDLARPESWQLHGLFG